MVQMLLLDHCQRRWSLALSILFLGLTASWTVYDKSPGMDFYILHNSKGYTGWGSLAGSYNLKPNKI